ncbi:MAG: mannonate dehydratase [Cytophagales bacterium]|nr:mannonate dehydratase [Bernardetiaceae bacterium]MDW8204698.1 mannonate dehydratase [Cytophagales bacterium]
MKNNIEFEYSFRWFGENDPVKLHEIKQAGATHIVTALHHVPNGQVWQERDIVKRKQLIENNGLKWTTVESVPVHEAIKYGGPERDSLIHNYIQTIEALAKHGIKTITYNFMPVLDWTRTDLEYPADNGGDCLAFFWSDICYFDLLVLQRLNAEKDYPAEIVQKLPKKTAAEEEKLIRTIIRGLPGSEESYSLATFKKQLSLYKNIDASRLRQNHLYFLSQVAPVAHDCGVKLALHPDDPPTSLFGLPRIAGSQYDFDFIFEQVNNPAVGLCFCTGSLGANPSLQVEALAERYAEKIHFLHLRNVHADKNGFIESDLLKGRVNIAKVIKAVMKKQTGSIPVRPDHGHRILYDLEAPKSNPGYTLLGRLKSLAEIKGIIYGLNHADDAL